MKLKTFGLLGALIFAAPVAAFAAPAGGLTADAASPAITAPALDTNAAATPGTSAKIDKVWWRGGYGYRRFGYGYGYGFRRFGYGFRRPFFGYYGRPFYRRRFFY